MRTFSRVFAIFFALLLLSLLFNCKKETLKVAPTVTIAEATNVTANSATVSSAVTADGGTEVLSRGVCWNTGGNPTTSDSRTSDGKGMGSFSSSLTSLSPGTTYNLKSYAINAIGTAYSSQATFKTLALLATLTTTEASTIASTTFSSGGNVTNDGGAEVTARGVCWSTAQNPTIADSKTTDGTGSGIFTSSVTGLTPGTTYYIRSYSTNSIGTAYGNQITSVTLAILPTVTTTDLSLITSTSATSGGNITNDGGAAIIARGVCWSTNQNPTIADSKSTDGTGKGIFASSITGLSPGIKYYFRAYAINSIGTAYGNQVISTTVPVIPSLTTTEVSDILGVYAKAGGNITSDGGMPITSRGVCWGTSQNPTVTNSKTTDGEGIGSFTSDILDLASNTTYYLRAYATNSVGTAYGNVLTFKTIEPSTDSDIKPLGFSPSTDAELELIPSISSLDISIVPTLKSGVILPDSVIIPVPPVGNQGNQNSCVGWTLGNGMMSQIFRIYEGRANFNGAEGIFSPNYIWNQLNNGQNKVITFASAFNLLKTQGCCKYAFMQVPALVTDLPSATAKSNAYNFRISQFCRFTMSDIEYGLIKTYLSKNFTIAVGMAVDKTFMLSNKDNNIQFERKDGRLVWTKYSGSSSKFGHAMLICGYDDAIHAYKVQNSWGKDWGENGYFWIDYDFFKEALYHEPFSTQCEVFVGFVKRPVLATNEIGEISSGTAKGGGSISSDWGYPVTSRGVCYNQTGNPTISDKKTSDGTGSGTFTSTLTGLDADTPYYVKAYAINSNGISYGYQKTFTTSKGNSLPTVTTSATSSINTTSAISGGNVTSDGNSSVTIRGVCWSTSQNPTTANSKNIEGNGTGSFVSDLTGLTPNTTYYIRAYATNSVGTAYGNQLSFTTTLTLSMPTLTTNSITNLSQNSATSGGNISSDGNAVVTARGVCWSTAQNPTTANSKNSEGNGTGSFASNLTGLTPNTTYYIRAYATNSIGTAYGDNVSFTTNAIQAQAPTLTTTAASAIATTSATSGGSISSDGGATVTARGVCWSTTQNPTTANSKNSEGNGTGSFASNLTGLTPNTTYYIRAYATNSVGTAYGNQLSFTTSTTVTFPSITTISTANITQNTASSGGNVTSDGGATVTARGVCWSTSSNPTTANTKTNDGAGTGGFTSSITGLAAGTTYYVRAYAINSVGTNYGNQVSFATIPSNSDGSVSDIDGNTYSTVTIGTQVWMKENLKTTKYNDNTAIPLIADDLTWGFRLSPGYCWLSNDAATYKETYGALYNWYTVNAGKLCPTGWHVPSDSEWITLTTYLGGINFAGDKLKEIGTSHWASPNSGATNESGFTALPGGYRSEGGPFGTTGSIGYWWSSSVKSNGNPMAWQMSSMYSYVYNYDTTKKFGLSVRCLKD